MLPATAQRVGGNPRVRLFQAIRVGVIGLIPAAFWCLADVAMSAPLSLNLEVENPQGGQVDGMPGGGPCRSTCTAWIERPRRVSLLAEPLPGYRFGGWQGACESTLGPLCTLAVAANSSVGARFERQTDSVASAYGVLLLPGVGETPSVWSKVVDRQFGGHCPVVYGGVLLGKLPDWQPLELRCYRLRFGYYGVLRSGQPNAGEGSSVSQLRNEIRAAVAGLLDDRPGLHLVLVGAARPLAAAEGFARTPSPEQRAVSGVLGVAGDTDQGRSALISTAATRFVAAAQIGAEAWRLLFRR